jgi:hypothetical protein
MSQTILPTDWLVSGVGVFFFMLNFKHHQIGACHIYTITKTAGMLSAIEFDPTPATCQTACASHSA